MKTAVVCGATQGIGYECAKALAKQGIKIVLVARNKEKLKQVAAELELISGISNDVVIADFSQPQVVEQAIKQWVSKGNTAQILINKIGRAHV